DALDERRLGLTTLASEERVDVAPQPLDGGELVGGQPLGQVAESVGPLTAAARSPASVTPTPPGDLVLHVLDIEGHALAAAEATRGVGDRVALASLEAAHHPHPGLRVDGHLQLPSRTTDGTERSVPET